ncbi:uncharacterized protein BXZ73DRAFT_53985 [Epithele typhae]|uniref:uncharacterized protein n=1 Tax=Epithele typhae TaxID=378194 RepID=UPI002007EFA8|nr:uncharacterized protein BXZ73DRAFT_53985 [Epithele typhae]KAH9916095.1 hypothetical protein BXZ73DRAFT_53985 [Epithele typhae]
MFEFAYSEDLVRFRHTLTVYTTIIQPLIRSLWALEALNANASDVWMFFMACAAYSSDSPGASVQETGISRELANEVIEKFNNRYDNLFVNQEIYFSAFLLDPRYTMRSDAFLILPTEPINVLLPRKGADLTVRHPRAFDRLKQFCKETLMAMVERAGKFPSEPVALALASIGDSTEITQALQEQLYAYWDGRAPFKSPLRPGETPLRWWMSLQDDRNASVLTLICVKVFSVLVNSMPDECTGSKVTWLNSPLRGRQDAQTLIDMALVGQYWSRKVTTRGNSHKRPPMVRVTFRDIEKDLIKAASGDVEVSDGDSDAGRITANDSDSGDESSDSDSLLDQQARRRRHDSSASTSANINSSANKTALLPSYDMDLTSPDLLDVLSDTPRVSGSSAASQSSSASASQPASSAPKARAPSMKIKAGDWDF